MLLKRSQHLNLDGAVKRQNILTLKHIAEICAPGVYIQ
jgi:hypothetical protein